WRSCRSGPSPKYENPRPPFDGPSDRGLGRDFDRVPGALPGRPSPGPDDRPRTEPPNASGPPPPRRIRLRPRRIGGTRLVLRALRGSPRHPEPALAPEPTRHLRALCVDPQPDRGISLPRGARGRSGRRLTGSRLPCFPPRDSREPPHPTRGTHPRIAVRGGISGLPGIGPPLDSAAAAATELNGHVHARVRSRRRRAELLEVDDVDRHTGELMQQSIDVAFPDDREDLATGFREPAQGSGHRRISFVDQDALRGRELRREFAEEALFVSVEALQLRFDFFFAGEKRPQRGSEEADAFPDRHLSPHPSEDDPRVFVDQHDLADLPPEPLAHDAPVHADDVIRSDPTLPDGPLPGPNVVDDRAVPSEIHDLPDLELLVRRREDVVWHGPVSLIDGELDPDPV